MRALSVASCQLSVEKRLQKLQKVLQREISLLQNRLESLRADGAVHRHARVKWTFDVMTVGTGLPHKHESGALKGDKR